MPNTSSSGSNSPSASGHLPFEEVLRKLEDIVEAMEGGDLPLETLLAKYEEGRQLTKVCQTKLAEAELRIQQLERNSEGELTLKPISPEASEAES